MLRVCLFMHIKSFQFTHAVSYSFRQALHISTFTLDEFEHALRHTVAELPCAILSEVHSVLIYNLRTVSFTKHSAIISMQYEDEEADMPIETMGVSTGMLASALGEVGNNWERVPLRHSEGRVGWEDALIGCLKDVRSKIIRIH
jgi:bromodomain adjacent to zinc finger domain protein 1A